MATKNVKYAWFSSVSAKHNGYAVWRTPDGREIVVTYVSDNPPPRNIQPGHAHMPPSYHCEDTVYQGEVTDFVKSFIPIVERKT